MTTLSTRKPLVEYPKTPSNGLGYYDSLVPLSSVLRSYLRDLDSKGGSRD